MKQAVLSFEREEMLFYVKAAKASCALVSCPPRMDLLGVSARFTISFFFFSNQFSTEVSTYLVLYLVSKGYR